MQEKRVEDVIVSTVCVGRHTSGAQCYVDDPEEVLEVLQALSRTASMRKSSSTTLLNKRTPRRFYGTLSPIRSTTALVAADDQVPSFDITQRLQIQGALVLRMTRATETWRRRRRFNLEFDTSYIYHARNPMKGSPSTDQVDPCNKAMRKAVKFQRI